MEIIVHNVSKEGRLLTYIVTEYFSDAIHSSEQTKKKQKKDELRDALARMKQMDELFKKTEKEHLETIAAMQKRIEELEGTFSNLDENHTCCGYRIQTTRCFHLIPHWISRFTHQS